MCLGRICTRMYRLTCLSPVLRSSTCRYSHSVHRSGCWTGRRLVSDNRSRDEDGDSGGGARRILPRTSRSHRSRFHTRTAGSHLPSRRTPRSTLSTQVSMNTNIQASCRCSRTYYISRLNVVTPSPTIHYRYMFIVEMSENPARGE